MIHRKGSWYQGTYTPKYPEKCLNKGNIEYRSSWEAKVCYLCDMSSNILKWGYELLKIPYTDIKGKVRTYITDFIVVLRSGDKIVKCVWEVKPQKQGPLLEAGKLNTKNKPQQPTRKTRKAMARYNYELKTYVNNTKKWNSLMVYCKSNGYVFEVISEQHIKQMMSRLSKII